MSGSWEKSVPITSVYNGSESKELGETSDGSPTSQFSVPVKTLAQDALVTSGEEMPITAGLLVPRTEDKRIEIHLQDGILAIPKSVVDVIGDLGNKLRSEWMTDVGESEKDKIYLTTTGGGLSWDIKMDDFCRIYRFALQLRDKGRSPAYSRIVNGTNYSVLIDFCEMFRFHHLSWYISQWLLNHWIPSLPSQWKNGDYGSEVDRMVHHVEMCQVLQLPVAVKELALEEQKKFVLQELVNPLFEKGMQSLEPPEQPKSPPYHVHATIGTKLPSSTEIMNRNFSETIVPKIYETGCFIKSSFPLWIPFISEIAFQKVQNVFGVTYDTRLALIAYLLIEQIAPHSGIMEKVKNGKFEG